MKASIRAIIALAAVVAPSLATTPNHEFSFFITSTSPGTGNLGGLDGADALCQRLAKERNARIREWRAYLSVSADESHVAINARDRIGSGPWYNVKGELIARDIRDLHEDARYLNKQTALTEKGERVNGVDDDPVDHDILTGSKENGTAFSAEEDRTCHNWTSDDAGFAQVGHHDRHGGPNGELTSWNSAHKSRGCNKEKLAAAGSSGRFYCFAVGTTSDHKQGN